MMRFCNKRNKNHNLDLVIYKGRYNMLKLIEKLSNCTQNMIFTKREMSIQKIRNKTFHIEIKVCKVHLYEIFLILVQNF